MKKLIHAKTKLLNTNQVAVELGYVNPAIYACLPIHIGRCIITTASKGTHEAVMLPMDDCAVLMLRNPRKRRGGGHNRSILTCRRDAAGLNNDIRASVRHLRQVANDCGDILSHPRARWPE
jgi:hypothetical protein